MFFEAENDGEISVENALMLFQGTFNSGLLFKRRSDGYEVFHAVRNSPAWRSGLRKGDVVVSVNGEDVSAWRDFLDRYNFSSYSKKIDRFFRVESEVSIGSREGRIYIFRNEGEPLLRRMRIFSPVMWPRLSVAVLCVLGGVYCSRRSYDEETSRPLSFSLVFASLAIGNTFSTIFYDYRLNVLMTVSFDVGTYASSGFLFRYISTELKKIRRLALAGEVMHYASFVPLFRWDVVSNPLFALARIVCCAASFL